jgi:AcrR family transcriptional regulator
VPAKPKPRLGRPPSSNSAETRRRILDSARETFAKFGYGATTNRILAQRADVTTAALYHYFDSKLTLYCEVYDEAQERIFTRFQSCIDGVPGFLDRFEAVLEAAHELNGEDPSLARFVGAARIDVIRYEEVKQATRQSADRFSFFFDLVDDAVKRGEVTKKDRASVLVLLRTVLVGLTDGASQSDAKHRLAVDAFSSIFEGKTLIKRID